MLENPNNQNKCPNFIFKKFGNHFLILLKSHSCNIYVFKHSLTIINNCILRNAVI